jgi:hypothetical protein
MTGNAPTIQAKDVLATFNAALASNDAGRLASCFYPDQAYWRDIVALTSHLRTLERPQVIATALLELIALRGLAGDIELTREVHFAVMSPVMVSCIPFPFSVPQLLIS